MISRRRLLLFPLSVGVIACSQKNNTPMAVSNDELLPEVQVSEPIQSFAGTPPHCEALSLVWAAKGDEIRQTEFSFDHTRPDGTSPYSSEKEPVWWFDTDARSWEVVRPFAPGLVDSTHWFNVRYTIAGREVGSWVVDTRKKTVS